MMAGTARCIINIIYIWFGKKCAKISNILPTRKQNTDEKDLEKEKDLQLKKKTSLE